MIWIVLPMLTMLVGFLAGICVMDAFYDNKKLNRLEKVLKFKLLNEDGSQ